MSCHFVFVFRDVSLERTDTLTAEKGDKKRRIMPSLDLFGLKPQQRKPALLLMFTAHCCLLQYRQMTILDGYDGLL